MTKFELPPVGTELQSKYRGEALNAKIIADPSHPGRRLVSFKGRTFDTLTGAAVAATGSNKNGWEFWKSVDGKPLKS